LNALCIQAEDDDDGMVYVQGAGASFPNTLYQNAIRVYRFVEPNVELSYTSMGSGNGKCRIADWEVSARFAGLHVAGGEGGVPLLRVEPQRIGGLPSEMEFLFNLL
jgi:hypothetical protein